jgi:hemolysin III
MSQSDEHAADADRALVTTDAVEPGRVLDHVSGGVRPSWRGVSHAVMFALAVPASVWLFANAPAHRAELGVYLVSLLVVLGVSASYHRLTRSPRAQLVMSRIDRGAIFALIAGTYTPIVLIAVPSPYSTLLLAVVWVLALASGTSRVLARLTRLSSTMYVVIGWLAVLAVPWLLSSPVLLAGLLAGGISYSVGAVLFAMRRPRGLPGVFGFHEFFHLFTLGGVVAHFACVAALVLAVNATP